MPTDDFLRPITSSTAAHEGLGLALYRASHAIAQLYRPALDRLGVTFPQYLVLTALWQDDGCSVKQLGERLELDSGTLSPMLRRLETSGYVRRERHAEDGRRVSVWLQPAGRAAKAEQDHIEVSVASRSGLSQQEAETLSGLAIRVGQSNSPSNKVDPEHT